MDLMLTTVEELSIKVGSKSPFLLLPTPESMGIHVTKQWCWAVLWLVWHFSLSSADWTHSAASVVQNWWEGGFAW